MASDIPDLNWLCTVCGQYVYGGLSDVSEHLATHGYQPERWPDGAPVVDMSDVPELLGGSDA